MHDRAVGPTPHCDKMHTGALPGGAGLSLYGMTGRSAFAQSPDDTPTTWSLFDTQAFDPAEYLTANPDIYTSGGYHQIASGARLHWLEFGANERRNACARSCGEPREALPR